MTQRLAFKMFLKPGCKEEYKKRHAALWPELRKLLKDSGVGNYSIFLDEETNILFAYQEVCGGTGSQDLGNMEINQKWWDFMADIMEVNPDNSPISIPLEDMFYME
ncbi:MAG: L-rhamnose mutarotase [Bacteroidales bacterium]|nr:L-rhamnose mutarotase [Bacteroidales bacterium]